MTDIKEVLRTAFDAEPPVRINRDQVVKDGRRRVMSRRMAVIGTTALAAVAVGSTMFLGVGQPDQVQPGATPPKPPMSSSSSAGPSSPLSTEVAQQFSKVLEQSRILPVGLALRATPGNSEALRFRPERNHYEASADVVNSQGKEGTLFVMVATSAGHDTRPTCAAPNTCVQREFGGRSVQLATVPFGSQGEVLLIAHTRLPDNTQIYAMTSNVSVKAVAEHGKGVSPPTTPEHLITLDQLGQIVGLPGLKL